MANTHVSQLHVFNVDDVAGSTLGEPAVIDFAAGPDEIFVDKSNNTLFPVDSTFGFYVRDFVGAADKIFDGDYAEGWVGDLEFGFPDDPDPLPPGWVTIEDGLGVRNAKTDIFLTGAPLGTWQVAMGGQSPVKASTEHYTTMADLLSDQAYPGDPDSLRTLDDDLRLLDYQVDESSNAQTFDDLHLLWLKELAVAMQNGIDYVDANGTTSPAPADDVRSDIDFDRDGSNDTYRITTETVDFEGAPRVIAAIDVGNNGSVDMVDGLLNGYGGTGDITDILEPNESSVTSDIAFGNDYSITVKDDGKLLYRWGEAVKRPNDVRMEVNLELPEEWTADSNTNGILDGLEDGGFVITRAELKIRHDITNNPNDQVRPEDYENEGATGRIPSHYIVRDPDDAGNILWVAPVDSYTGRGQFLPSYLVLDGSGNVVNSDVAPPNSTAVFDPDGVRVGYRNDLVGGTVLKNEALIALNTGTDLDFVSADLAEGFTAAWYTTVNREPFEWSYDTDDSPYINVFESFRSPEEAAEAGYFDDDLASGPRWRLTPNKFGQDLPGLEVPVTENSQPPYQKANIKYPTGEFTTTTLNLLDWEGDTPFATSLGMMSISSEQIDENADGLIDEGWSSVNGTLGAGDAVPGLILTATSPNGINLEPEFLDTAVYVKGDRQDDARLYDIQMEIDWEAPAGPDAMGTVQLVEGLTHVEQTVSFEGSTTLDDAVVFALPPTRNGGDPGSVTITDVTSTSASIFFEEPDYLSGNHPAAEAVSLLALEEGNWTLADGTQVEVGTINVASGSTDVFQTVTFGEAFDEAPIVIAQLQTNNGSDWAVIRTDNASATSFDFIIEEQEASDGLHDAEVLGYVAIDVDASSGLLDWSGLDAQVFSTGQTVRHDKGSFTFDATLGDDPIISAGIASHAGKDTVALRLKDLMFDGTATTAQFRTQEEQSFDEEVGHAKEVVAGIAFSGEGVLEALPSMEHMVLSDGMDIA